MLYNFVVEIKTLITITTKNIMATTSNIIAYYRTSTSKQNLGLEAQRNIVTSWARQRNANIMAEYSEQESGKHNDRPQLTLAIAEAKKNNATLVIAKLDRLSREAEFLFHLHNDGVQIAVCDLPELNTLTLGIFATLAQHERELISTRTKQALQALKAKGVKLGSPSPKWSPEAVAKSLKIRQHNADNNLNTKQAYCAIKHMNCSLQAKADYLNENGFKTARGGKYTAMQVKRTIERFSAE